MKKMVIVLALVIVGGIFGSFVSANITDKSTTTYCEIHSELEPICEISMD